MGEARIGMDWYGGIGEARIDKEGLGGLGSARLGSAQLGLILLWRFWMEECGAV